MLYKKAERLDPSVYHHMRNVPVEYQKEKQREFRHLEEDKDSGFILQPLHFIVVRVTPCHQTI